MIYLSSFFWGAGGGGGGALLVTLKPGSKSPTTDFDVKIRRH